MAEQMNINTKIAASAVSSSHTGFGNVETNVAKVSLPVRLVRALFGMLYLAAREDKRSNLTTLVLFTVDFLQMMSFPLTQVNELSLRARRSSGIEHGNQVLDFISVVTKFASIDSAVRAVSHEVFLAAFATAFAFLCVYLGLVFWVCARSFVNANQHPAALKAVRGLAVVSSTILFIPCVSVLASWLTCKDLRDPSGEYYACFTGIHLAVSVPAWFLFVPFVILSLFVALAFINRNPTATGYGSRTHGRIEALLLVWKVAIIIVFTQADSIDIWVLWAFLFGAGCTMLYGFFTIMPYIIDRMNMLRAGMSSAYMWAVICFFLSLTSPGLDTAIMTICGLPICFVGGVYTMKGRLDWLATQPSTKLTSFYQLHFWSRRRLAVAARFLKQAEMTAASSARTRHNRKISGSHRISREELTEEQSVTTDIFSSFDGDQDPLVHVTSSLVNINPTTIKAGSLDLRAAAVALQDQVESAMELIMERYTNSGIALVCAAAYYRQFHENHFLEMTALALARRATSAPDVSFSVYSRLRMLREDHSDDYSRMSAIDRVLYEQWWRNAVLAEGACYRNILRLWTSLLEEVPDLAQLQQLSERLHVQMERATEAYKAVIKLASDSVPVLRAYATFVANLQHMPDKAQEYLNKADRIEENAAKRRGHTVKRVVYGEKADDFDSHDDETAVLMVAADPHRLGEIVSANPVASKLFGIPRMDILGRNAAELFPFPFCDSYASLLASFAATGRGSLLNDARVSVCITGTNQLTAVRVMMREAPIRDHSDELPKLTLLAQRLHTDAGLILFDNVYNGFKMLGCCARSAALLEVDRDALSRHTSSLGDYFPELLVCVRGVTGRPSARTSTSSLSEEDDTLIDHTLMMHNKSHQNIKNEHRHETKPVMKWEFSDTAEDLLTTSESVIMDAFIGGTHAVDTMELRVSLQAINVYLHGMVYLMSWRIPSAKHNKEKFHGRKQLMRLNTSNTPSEYIHTRTNPMSSILKDGSAQQNSVRHRFNSIHSNLSRQMHTNAAAAVSSDPSESLSRTGAASAETIIPLSSPQTSVVDQNMGSIGRTGNPTFTNHPSSPAQVRLRYTNQDMYTRERHNDSWNMSENLQEVDTNALDTQVRRVVNQHGKYKISSSPEHQLTLSRTNQTNNIQHSSSAVSRLNQQGRRLNGTERNENRSVHESTIAGQRKLLSELVRSFGTGKFSTIPVIRRLRWMHGWLAIVALVIGIATLVQIFSMRSDMEIFVDNIYASSWRYRLSLYTDLAVTEYQMALQNISVRPYAVLKDEIQYLADEIELASTSIRKYNTPLQKAQASFEYNPSVHIVDTSNVVSILSPLDTAAIVVLHLRNIIEAPPFDPDIVATDISTLHKNLIPSIVPAFQQGTVLSEQQLTDYATSQIDIQSIWFFTSFGVCTITFAIALILLLRALSEERNRTMKLFLKIPVKVLRVLHRHAGGMWHDHQRRHDEKDSNNVAEMDDVLMEVETSEQLQNNMNDHPPQSSEKDAKHFVFAAPPGSGKRGRIVPYSGTLNHTNTLKKQNGLPLPSSSLGSSIGRSYGRAVAATVKSSGFISPQTNKFSLSSETRKYRNRSRFVLQSTIKVLCPLMLLLVWLIANYVDFIHAINGVRQHSSQLYVANDALIGIAEYRRNVMNSIWLNNELSRPNVNNVEDTIAGMLGNFRKLVLGGVSDDLRDEQVHSVLSSTALKPAANLLLRNGCVTTQSRQHGCETRFTGVGARGLVETMQYTINVGMRLLADWQTYDMDNATLYFSDSSKLERLQRLSRLDFDVSRWTGVELSTLLVDSAKNVLKASEELQTILSIVFVSSFVFTAWLVMRPMVRRMGLTLLASRGLLLFLPEDILLRMPEVQEEIQKILTQQSNNKALAMILATQNARDKYDVSNGNHNRRNSRRLSASSALDAELASLSV